MTWKSMSTRRSTRSTDDASNERALGIHEDQPTREGHQEGQEDCDLSTEGTSEQSKAVVTISERSETNAQSTKRTSKLGPQGTSNG